MTLFLHGWEYNDKTQWVAKATLRPTSGNSTSPWRPNLSGDVYKMRGFSHTKSLFILPEFDIYIRGEPFRE